MRGQNGELPAQAGDRFCGRFGSDRPDDHDSAPDQASQIAQADTQSLAAQARVRWGTAMSSASLSAPSTAARTPGYDAARDGGAQASSVQEATGAAQTIQAPNFTRFRVDSTHQSLENPQADSGRLASPYRHGQLGRVLHKHATRLLPSSASAARPAFCAWLSRLAIAAAGRKPVMPARAPRLIASSLVRAIARRKWSMIFTIGLILVMSESLVFSSAASASTRSGIRLSASTEQTSYRLGDRVRLRFTITNIGTQPCLISSTANSTLILTTVTRNGRRIIPSRLPADYLIDHTTRVVNQLRMVGADSSITIPVTSLTSTPFAGSLDINSWSQIGGDIESFWSVAKPGQYNVSAVYVTPDTGGLKRDVCPGISNDASINFTVAANPARYPSWLILASAAFGLLILGLVAFVTIRRPRRSIRTGFTAVLFVACTIAVITSAPKAQADSDGLFIESDGDPTYAAAVNHCLDILRADGDPDGVLAQIAASKHVVGITPVDHNKIHDIWWTHTEPDRVARPGWEDGGVGSAIFWSPPPWTDYNYREPSTGKEGIGKGAAIDPCSALYHELSHARDFARGMETQRNSDGTITRQMCDETGLTTTQVRAILAENKDRAARRPPLRLREYAWDDITRKRLVKVPLSLDECHPNPPPQPAAGGSSSGLASTAGDTHIATFNGAYYDFQAVGEFVAMKSTTDSMEIQTRQARVQGASDISVNSAVAMNVNGDHVGLYLESNGVVERLNGTSVHFKQGATRLPHGGTFSSFDNAGNPEYAVTWPDGSQAWVSPIVPDEMDLQVELNPIRRGHITGLLGNFTGESTGNLVARGGQHLPRNPTFDDIYHVFGDSWRIRQGESLFDYQPGQSTRTFTDLNFPSQAVSSDNLANRDAAAALCRAAGVTNPAILQGCTLDVAITGQSAFLASAATLQRFISSSQRSNNCSALWYAVSTPAAMRNGAESCHRFSASAGDVAELLVNGDGLTADLDVISPAGKTICSNVVTGGFDCAIPATGTYTVLVRDHDHHFTGTYTLWAQRLNNPIGCASLWYAVSTPAAMRNGAESCHRFSASAGDVAELLVNGDGLTADLDVISPAGKTICSDVVTGGFDCAIPATGTYTVLVRDHDHHFTGTYTLWAQRLNNPIGCASLSYAVSTPAAMRNGAESCHRFSASAGDVAELLVNGDGLTADLDVISPAGKTICSNVVTGGFDCAIPATGTYTVLVRDHDHHFTGTYRLTVSKKA